MEREKRERYIYVNYPPPPPANEPKNKFRKLFFIFKCTSAIRYIFYFFSWSMYLTALIFNFLKDAIALGVPRVSRDIHFGKRVRHDYMYH